VIAGSVLVFDQVYARSAAGIVGRRTVAKRFLIRIEE
jgi:hypothetical protein